MYRMDWDISFNNESTGKKYALALVSSFEITKSVENLVDTADIVLPEGVLNKVMNIESKISRGTKVEIQLGYDGKLRKEFFGYVTEILTNDSQLRIKCEDALFLFRKAVKDEQLKPAKMSTIVQSLINQIDPTFSLVCDFDISYEKFVIHKATAYDVLKKLAEETKANIYFNTENKQLHIHPPYFEKSGEVIYDMAINIESSSLEYKRAADRKFEITIETTNSKGEILTAKSGDTGGDSVNIKVSSMTQADLQNIADAELIKRSADAFEGSIQTWAIPYVEPTYTAIYRDADYPEKNGSYYVTKTVTSFSDAGIVRNVSFGKKLS